MSHSFSWKCLLSDWWSLSSASRLRSRYSFPTIFHSSEHVGNNSLTTSERILSSYFGPLEPFFPLLLLTLATVLFDMVPMSSLVFVNISSLVGMFCDAMQCKHPGGFPRFCFWVFGCLGEFTKAAKKLTKLLKIWGFGCLGEFFLGEFPKAPSVPSGIRRPF